MPDVQELLKGAQDAITAKRVYGDPMEVDGVTVVPAASVRGGGGGGGDSDNNGGGGFGLMARPVGAFVIRPGGEVVWKPAVDAQQILLLGAAVVALWAFARR
jgi:uncharacterized spore protein YtfJ